MVDRYGSTYGSFLSPMGTPSPMRALSPGTTSSPPDLYELLKPLKVRAGKIAPAFRQPGGGIQYELLFDKSVQDLLDAKILGHAGGQR